MANGSDFSHEVRIRRADGQERWLAATGQLTRDSSGHPLKMIGVNYDITERKRVEAELREARAEPRPRIARRIASSRSFRTSCVDRSRRS